MQNHDKHYMQTALALAKRAYECGEIPVGAVVVLHNKIIGLGHNQSITNCDPSGHGEIIAIRQAAAAIGNYRLVGASLYVTLEPCMMCAAAAVQARIKRVIFGARDAKNGAAGSICNLLESPLLNHQCEVIAGVESARCSELLMKFFQQKR